MFRFICFIFIVLLSLTVTGCFAPSEKRLTYEEEVEMKQLREENRLRSPQDQKAFDCAEWRKRHPAAKQLGDALLESGQEPLECDMPQDNKQYDFMKQRDKDIDAIIDKQLKEQSTK